MNTFVIRGRCIAAPPPSDWRDELTRRLGAKPRRIGTWAELGLFGALRCLAESGETALPHNALLLLGSRRGTYAATAQVLEQMRDGQQPMPLAFLQTQPSQLLALLAAQLEWQGDACFLAGAQPLALLRLAAAQTDKADALLGWVDEMDGGSSQWLRLGRCTAEGNDFVAAAQEEMFSAAVSHLRIAAAGLQVCHAG